MATFANHDWDNDLNIPDTPDLNSTNYDLEPDYPGPETAKQAVQEAVRRHQGEHKSDEQPTVL
jgi:hypothetical protein